MTGTKEVKNKTIPVVRLNLPLPPSVNHAYRPIGNKIMRTRIYRDWVAEVCEEQRKPLPQYPDKQRYGLLVFLPTTMRGDGDNRVKLLSDVLQRPDDDHPHRLGVVQDDKLMRAHYVGRHRNVVAGRCWAFVVPWYHWFDYVGYMLKVERDGFR